MVFISQLQKETLFLVDDLVNKGMDHTEIVDELQKNGYYFEVTIKNGYASKTKMRLIKNNENSFVDLIKRRNGKASWETWKLS